MLCSPVVFFFLLLYLLFDSYCTPASQLALRRTHTVQITIVQIDFGWSNWVLEIDSCFHSCQSNQRSWSLLHYRSLSCILSYYVSIVLKEIVLFQGKLRRLAGIFLDWSSRTHFLGDWLPSCISHWNFHAWCQGNMWCFWAEKINASGVRLNLSFILPRFLLSIQVSLGVIFLGCCRVIDWYGLAPCWSRIRAKDWCLGRLCFLLLLALLSPCCPTVLACWRMVCIVSVQFLQEWQERLNQDW